MKVIIAGGGTGGHIYPAISIAQALLSKDPSTQIAFVGTPSGMEKKIIPQAGYRLLFIQSGKLNMSGQIVEKCKSLLKIPLGLFQSFKIIRREKPDFVLGVGGYASAPFTLCASLLGIKTALWEPNAHPGMANRILSRFVQRSYLVFDEGKKYLRTRVNLALGMPLRHEIENGAVGRSPEQRIFTLLCFGGSQGSMFLNDKLCDLLLNDTDLLKRMRVIHQTGARDFARVKSRYADMPGVEVYEYIYDMPKFYRQADLLFCRGGASTLAEAAVFGVVPIMVPLPAADDHQEKNATLLEKKRAGFLLTQKKFDPEQFKKIIVDAVEQKINLNDMSARLREIVSIGAAGRIADDITQIVGSAKGKA